MVRLGGGRGGAGGKALWVLLVGFVLLYVRRTSGVCKSGRWMGKVGWCLEGK